MNQTDEAESDGHEAKMSPPQNIIFIFRFHFFLGTDACCLFVSTVESGV